jgi:O-antigen ligase
MRLAVAVVVGSLIAFLSMPISFNVLALVGGELTVRPLQSILTAALVLGAVIAATQFRQARALLKATNRYLLIFIFLATASVAWSVFPLTTVARLYRLYAEFFACALLALVAWQPSRFPRVLGYALLFLTVTSIIYRLVDPAGALEEAAVAGNVQLELLGAWRGITLQKNTLGTIAGIGTIVWLSELTAGRRPLLPAWIGLVASITCLVGSRSNTSMFAAIFCVALMQLILKAPAIKNRRTVHALMFVLVSFFLVYSLGVLDIVPGFYSFIEPFVAMTGKDMSFSGRTSIWAIVKDEIALHPFLGIGYAAYWTGPDDPLSPSAVFLTRLGFYPGEAHNGYLDVLNELGVVGIIALIGYVFEFLRQSVRVLSFDRGKAALCIALLFYNLIGNMSEAYWWNGYVGFFILTLASFDLARSTLEMGRQARASSRSPSTGLVPRPGTPRPAVDPRRGFGLTKR